MHEFEHRRTHYRPGERLLPHDHDEFGVSIVVAGQLIEQVGSTEEQAGCGSLVVKPAGAVHSNRFGPEGAMLISVAPSQLVACGLDEGLMAHWRWFHGGRLAPLAVRMAQELASDDRLGWAEEAVVSVLHELDGGSPRLRSPAPVAWLKGVRDRLHANVAVRPSVAGLAREIGVHPAHLTRQFRRAYGCSLSAYVRRLKAREAATALLGGRSLTAVAHDLGFADQSHFCRTFRAELGTSPGAFRRLVAP